MARAALSAGLRQHPIDHLHEHALLGFGELVDAIELLLEIGRWPGLSVFPISSSMDTPSVHATT